MIPNFPTFKPLEITDREEIISHTSKFLPYSDFNFTSMWSWDTENKIIVSDLYGNLVVRFADYITGDPFYSFIGTNKIGETVTKLIKLAKDEGIEPTLKLVPEEIAVLIRNNNQFVVIENRDNFDYVFYIDTLAHMSGAKLASKRNYIKQFQRNNEYVFESLNMQSERTWEEIAILCEDWASSKNILAEDFKHEFQAIERYFSMLNYTNHEISCLRIDGKLVGFWAIEILDKNFAISHFQKAKHHIFTGIYPYLNQAGSAELLKKDIKLINFEQDLGIPGLREGKTDYDPCRYLKKFTVEIV